MISKTSTIFYDMKNVKKLLIEENVIFNCSDDWVITEAQAVRNNAVMDYYGIAVGGDIEEVRLTLRKVNKTVADNDIDDTDG